MFEALSENLTAVLQRLSGRGVLTDEDLREGLREIRGVLLEADVGYDLTRDFVQRVREETVGLPSLKAVKPGEQLVKAVFDELVVLLGGETAGLGFASVPPTVVLLVGLQGSGKTTTAAKLAARLKREQKAPFLVAADVYRPAAEEQLRVLGDRVGVEVFGPRDLDGEASVAALVEAGVRAGASARARTILVDTAGRLQIDAAMMDELAQVKATVQPHEVLLVADAMTGQDAVRIAEGFHEGVGVTGVVLTKLDGDARGGAALSIHGATGAPIKFVGVGEGTDALEVFDPARMASRILQRGDVVGLVERAERAFEADEAERLARKASSKKGMDLEDFLAAMQQVQKMGPLQGLLGMLPGVSPKMVQEANVDPKRIKHVEAIIQSMTPDERRRPKVLNGSRRARIARGAGRPVQEVNRLVKQFEQMQKLMKRGGRGGMAGFMQQMAR